MANWSGRRKMITVFLFLAPTLIGILIFNIYPMVFNAYISLTNRNQFRPNPDCTIIATRILEPSCWGVFGTGGPRGVGQAYRLHEPIYRNYSDLMGGLFSAEGVLALSRFVIFLLPLFVAARINKFYDRQLTRPVSSIWIWLGALTLMIPLLLLLDLQGATAHLQRSGDFFVVVFRTIVFVALTVPINYIVGMILALILNSEHIKGRTFFRAVMIIPWAASTMFIIMALIWQFFFREQGTVNQILLALFNYRGPAWLRDPFYAFAIILLVNLWFSFPFAFNIILGALQAIPQDMYEAAEVDGASYFQVLFNITLPLIRPVVLPAVVLSAIGAGGFQMFGTVWAITQGGPTRGAGAPGATELVMIYAYRQVFQFNAYARAGAFAVIIFVFLFLATIYSLRLTRITKGAYE
jgi:arabinogalactan oligomer / maltooligosaccharide transport system permease protein